MNAPALLTAPELIARARAATGLLEFDDLPLDEPLEVLTRSLRTEAQLNAGGVAFWNDRLLNILATRLRAQALFSRHPEILEERIVAPVVIVGLTRTGTTLLQRLIASDSRFYSAAWWELRFPAPGEDDSDGEKRIAAAKAEIAALLQAAPELAAVHPFDALGADEDILLLDQTLFSTTAESLACIPGFRSWLRAQNPRPAYAYWKRLLQLLQWQKNRRGVYAQRWVLKTPMHLGHVDVIVELMPDASFVQTHRDPLATIPSFASMVHGLWHGGSDAPDAAEAARQWTATLEHDLNRCLAAREKLPPERFTDVDFRDTVRDPIGVVERIYGRVGMSMTDAARTQIAAYMARHPREARPPHEYSLEQFGLTDEEIRRRFSAYRARHIDAAVHG